MHDLNMRLATRFDTSISTPAQHADLRGQPGTRRMKGCLCLLFLLSLGCNNFGNAKAAFKQEHSYSENTSERLLVSHSRNSLVELRFSEKTLFNEKRIDGIKPLLTTVDHCLSATLVCHAGLNKIITLEKPNNSRGCLIRAYDAQGVPTQEIELAKPENDWHNPGNLSASEDQQRLAFLDTSGELVVLDVNDLSEKNRVLAVKCNALLKTTRPSCYWLDKNTVVVNYLRQQSVVNIETGTIQSFKNGKVVGVLDGGLLIVSNLKAPYICELSGKLRERLRGPSRLSGPGVYYGVLSRVANSNGTILAFEIHTGKGSRRIGFQNMITGEQVNLPLKKLSSSWRILSWTKCRTP